MSRSITSGASPGTFHEVIVYICGRSLENSLHATLLMASILLLFSLALLSSFPLSTAGEPIYSLCETARNYTEKSTFRANLGSLITSLSSSAPATGFANDTAGDAADRAYGLAVCRGDINNTDCRSCLAGALQDALTACPRSKSATIFYELCQLRYSDQYFFGESTGKQLFMWNVLNVSAVPAFNRALGILVDKLTTRAASSDRKFAAGSSIDPETKVYALVQCTRDLAAKTCDSCLRDSVTNSFASFGMTQGARIIGGSCFLRYESYPFFNATAAADTPPAIAPSPAPLLTPSAGSPAVEGDKKSNTAVIAGSIAATLIAFISLSAAIGIYLRRKRRTRKDGESDGEDLNEGESLQFSIEDLRLATMNFSSENKLGQGGFGVVYKGVLADGKLIAVKRLLKDSCQGLSELKNEVGLVAKLQHRNLVRLLGYCLQAQEKILVYEYLPNKSLDKFLFDPIRSKELNWGKRLNIIEGVARGLLYLHEDSRLKIIHRDVKASNILLDEAMHAKISDFGLARPFENGQSYANTNRIAGSYGYMAPEYVMHGHISTKSDVYSFGVLVLEILTRKKCTDFHGSNSSMDLISYISWLWEEGNPSKLLDKDIAEGVYAEEVLRAIHIGLLCVQHNPLERPDMSSVVQFLSNKSTSLPTISRFLGFSIMMKTLNSSPVGTISHSQEKDIVSLLTNNTKLEPR